MTSALCLMSSIFQQKKNKDNVNELNEMNVMMLAKGVVVVFHTYKTFGICTW